MGGSNPTLVFIHGYLGGAAQWKDQVEHFRHRFRVIAPDLPGFGRRHEEIAPDRIVDFARGVLEYLDNRGVGPFMLVGHSMGGMIAQEMAIRAAHRVSRLVLYGTGPLGTLPDRFEPIATSQARIEIEGVEPAIRPIVASWFLAGASAPAYNSCVDLAVRVKAPAALAALSAMENWDGREQLARIKAPTLVLWGDQDRSYGWRQPEMLWRVIPAAALAVIPGSAHNVHQEKPEIFNLLLDDFLSDPMPVSPEAAL
ncbi:alpha/beta fold hydrolase [Paracoccus yeei]|uniref:alpha/beta fold hydrolase n=1 Tax=Paracoccus yeei TaxID=147645 RepID=UPI00055E6A63|nr:alpha/beta hydrolase [Paracoccus yeei]OWJ90068.1 alpha/beta hydrolase [Paracoccus yeei]